MLDNKKHTHTHSETQNSGLRSNHVARAEVMGTSPSRFSLDTDMNDKDQSLNRAIHRVICCVHHITQKGIGSTFGLQAWHHSGFKSETFNVCSCLDKSH